MRTTGHSAGIWLLTFLAVATSMACAYLLGYWAVFGEDWTTALSLEQAASLPWKVQAGLGAVSAACAFMANRLVAYAWGGRVRPVAIVVCALALFVAMHLAIYEQFEWMELYPFTGFFVVSLLLFRFETKAVAAILFGVIVIIFYVLCAKELGNRDAELLALGPATRAIHFT